mmetsp:Transcript_65941/g.212706  ORF Transcript_65941/g.212706 Transcript_65941/m.212706 type:complete len:225 (+) Transcript_65941:128-802(+)
MPETASWSLSSRSLSMSLRMSLRGSQESIIGSPPDSLCVSMTMFRHLTWRAGGELSSASAWAPSYILSRTLSPRSSRAQTSTPSCHALSKDCLCLSRLVPDFGVAAPLALHWASGGKRSPPKTFTSSFTSWLKSNIWRALPSTSAWSSLTRQTASNGIASFLMKSAGSLRALAPAASARSCSLSLSLRSLTSLLRSLSIFGSRGVRQAKPSTGTRLSLMNCSTV